MLCTFIVKNACDPNYDEEVELFELEDLAKFAEIHGSDRLTVDFYNNDENHLPVITLYSEFKEN